MKKWIIGLVVVLAIGALAFASYQASNKETLYNEGFVNGNTAGNLYNGGKFCEYNGVIYFSNPNDGGKLYSMDMNGQNLCKLTNDTATYINVDDNYIYYIRNNTGDGIDYNFFSFYQNALVRVSKDGKETLILDTDPCLYASLIGNYIYYIHYDEQDASTLYKVCIDGTGKQKVASEAFYTCNADGQYFYYNGMSVDGSIHRYDTTTDTSKIVYSGNCFQPVVQNGEDVYYISGNHDYALVHTNLNFDNPTVVTTDSLESYNVYGSYIYYQRYDDDGSALCMIKNDGTESKVIAEGAYCDIHVTTYFVFFTEFYSGQQYYILRSTPDQVMEFNPGIIEE